MSEDTPTAPAPLSSTCPTCGAQTAYAPGTTTLKCGSCGTELEIAASAVTIREHSLEEWTAKHGDVLVASLGTHVLRCQGCGASTETVDLAGSCQFCGGALIAVEHPEGLVAPEAVVPFHVDRRGAQEAFGKWVRSRRFAPNALKKIGSTEGLQGTYVPHWTYDAHTETDYEGQRGTYYYVTVSHQVSDGKGGTRTETRQERRTSWSHAEGHVSRSFDDVLVVGSKRLDRKKLDKMGPWELGAARPFQQEYLTGYSALRYDVDPQHGSTEARQQMQKVIEDDCEHDIGGDEQRVSDMDVSYTQAMFKLMLMPLWIATYLYGGKTWQVMVNANTGEVVGERPWSVAKIVAAVVAALVVIAIVVAIVLATREPGSASSLAPPIR
jgi:hypothetical protein